MLVWLVILRRLGSAVDGGHRGTTEGDARESPSMEGYRSNILPMDEPGSVRSALSCASLACKANRPSYTVWVGRTTRL